jgi:S-adenosylmethionine hydrolase
MKGTRSSVPPAPVVSLLTDFGLRDPSAAICKGVVMRICPKAAVIDISHDVDKYSVRSGALLLWCALPYLPVGVHVAVVDPGVGTSRRPVALSTDRGDVLIGPDNGLLLPAAERLGGLTAAFELVNPEYRLHPVSTSFHGRDIFAPAAGHLATGVALDELGPPIDPAALVTLAIPPAEVRPGSLGTSVVYVDTFGNVKLAGMRDDLEAAVGPLASGRPMALEAEGRELTMAWAGTFGDVGPGEPLLYEDSYGRLCIAVNQGDAAGQLGLAEDQSLNIRTA